MALQTGQLDLAQFGLQAKVRAAGGPALVHKPVVVQLDNSVLQRMCDGPITVSTGHPMPVLAQSNALH
jgi:hypothetical protein